PTIPTLMRPWPAISAVAAPMSASAAPSAAPPRRYDAMTEHLKSSNYSRRQILVAGATLSGGLALGLFIPGPARAAVPELDARFWADETANPNEINAWVVIEPDDTVSLRCPMAEMGQGTASGIAMLLAEELECRWQ